MKLSMLFAFVVFTIFKEIKTCSQYSALVSENANCSVVYINHVLRLVRDIKPKPLSYHTMPCRSKLLVHCGLNELRRSLPNDLENVDHR